MLDLGDGFCTMLANLRALVDIEMVLTLRDGTFIGQSTVMVHRSLTKFFKSALIA